MYEYAFVIGRFQMFHRGHEWLLNEARKLGKELVVLVGSSNVPRSIKNPFTSDSRMRVLRSFDGLPKGRVIKLQDYPLQDHLWVAQVKNIISNVTDGASHCIVGCDKDESTYYLSIFGDTPVVSLPHIEEFAVNGIDATNFRNAVFNGWGNAEKIDAAFEKYSSSQMKLNAVLKAEVLEAFPPLLDEFRSIQKYKKSWASAPFPPIFVTADNIVQHRDRFLVVVRKGHPAKGLLAMPGGFIEHDERIRTSALRELREETSLEVFNPKTGAKIPFQDEWFRATKYYDSPSRSLRGRTITHAFFWYIPDKYEVKIAAADDAADVVWIPLTELQNPENASKFMEDHFHIIKDMIG